MLKPLLTPSLLATVAVFGMSFIAPVAVGAAPVQPSHPSQNTQENKETAQANSTVNHELAKTRLDDKKLKSCEKHQKAVTNIMTHISERGQKQITLFSTIAERTEQFYTKKGKTLANYDSLVADVGSKKAAAQASLDAIKSPSNAFNCAGDDPKGTVASFKESLKAEHTALKDFKTSVKNLIVGVKSVQGTTSSGDKKTTKTEGAQQ